MDVPDRSTWSPEEIEAWRAARKLARQKGFTDEELARFRAVGWHKHIEPEPPDAGWMR